ncbi:mCG59742 [Mus musculus]|nr:mCG59742 [Mus musculus]
MLSKEIKSWIQKFNFCSFGIIKEKTFAYKIYFE